MSGQDSSQQPEKPQASVEPARKKPPSMWPIYVIFVGYGLLAWMIYKSLSQANPGSSIRPMDLMTIVALINLVLIVLSVYFASYYTSGNKKRTSSTSLAVLCIMLALGSCCWTTVLFEFFGWIFDLTLKS